MGKRKEADIWVRVRRYRAGTGRAGGSGVASININIPIPEKYKRFVRGVVFVAAGVMSQVAIGFISTVLVFVAIGVVGHTPDWGGRDWALLVVFCGCALAIIAYAQFVLVRVLLGADGLGLSDNKGKLLVAIVALLSFGGGVFIAL